MIFVFGDLELDDDLFEARIRNTPAFIQKRAFDVLLYLAKNTHRVVPKEELLARLWDSAHVSGDALVQAIAVVRGVLEEAALGDLIQTVRGRGYRLRATPSKQRAELPRLERL